MPARAYRPSHTPEVTNCYRLQGPEFWVDVRTYESNGRWLAGADTPDGPSVGLGATELVAMSRALRPFRAIRTELLASRTIGLSPERGAQPEPWTDTTDDPLGL